MARIVVDPITRIEGHLRIEAEVADGVVKDAWSSSTMFRGIEKILKGRDPRDAWLFTQRFCGVCTTVHSIASIRAVEQALQIRIPLNAQLIRNIIIGSQCVQDHVIHFYHLHALDWVDITSALKADPGKTAQLAASISEWPLNSPTYFKGVQDKVQAFVSKGRLGPFANAYWGHPAYRLPPEANLMAVAHYLEALEWQKEIIKIHAILGSKNPHPQTFLVGGMAIPIDLSSQNALNDDKIAEIRQHLAKARVFVEQVYIPDLLAIASFYKEWGGVGGSAGNFLSYGEYPADASGHPQKLWLPPGVIRGKDLGRLFPMDQKMVSEYVDHSWYDYDGYNGKGLHPFDGRTEEKYTGPRPPYQHLEVEGKYSWVKAPRYDNQPMEVGPLARLLVAYAAGHKDVRETVDGVLKKLSVGPEALFSTLGRTAARGIETLLVARQLPVWLDQLVQNVAGGDTATHNGEKWDPATWPQSFSGFGLHEAPRGSLGHWIKVQGQQIAQYQAVVPSTWNASPRDAAGVRGPYETALLGTPVADPTRPLELLRTVHSFDPCLACAVHLYDPARRELGRATVL